MMEALKPLKRIAFFDLDETLISIKSLLRFAHYLSDRASGGLRTAASETTEKILSNELTRAEANREYFRMFEGVAVEYLAELGRNWLEFESQSECLYNKRTLAEIAGHRAAGAEIWIVSGSLQACVEPVAEAINATGFRCAEQEIGDEGVFTGQLTCSRIGPGKALAVAEVIQRSRGSLLDVWAYGDHITDLPMLAMADHPVVVDPDPQLSAVAHALNWKILSIDAKVGKTS